MATNKKVSILDKTWRALGFKEWAKTASENEVATALDSIAIDKEAEDADTHPEGCRCADCMPGGKDAKDKKEKDDKEEEQKATDAEMEKLESTLKGKAEDKEDEPEGEDEDEPEVEDEEAEDEEEPEAEDEAVQSEASKPLSKSERAKSPAPSAVDGMTVIRALKPFIAKTTDKKVKAAFDNASKIVMGARPKKNASPYKEFARASATVGKDAAEQMEQRNKAAKIADETNAEYRKMRGVSTVKK